MSRPALVALTLAAVLAVTSAPDPCCLRVTPYHIQALAQRMAQRFQALEYRAQDLRYVFASFQAVHGNVTHRLRYLEAEHAHLSEMVGRLDSRLHSLEEEKRMEEYKQRVEYYRRGQRDSDIQTSVEHLLKPPARMPYVMRRRREEEEAELPHLLVHLEQPKESSGDTGLPSPTNDPTQSAYPAKDPVTISDILPAPFTSSEPEIVHLDLESVTSEPEVAPSGTERDSTPRSPVFINKGTEASPQLVHAASASDSATTPTPLWQLEETASALLNVMSAGDDDNGVGDANVPNEAVDDAVSYWSPANETDSLEELFYPKHQPEDPGAHKCTGHSTGNCSEAASEVQATQADGTAIAGTPTEAAILDSVVLDATDNSSGFTHPEDAVTFVSHATAVSDNNSSTTNRSSGNTTVNVSDLVLKTTGCKTQNRLPSDPPPLGSVGNLTSSLLDIGNSTDSLLDIFSSGADGLANGPSPLPDGGGGDGDGSTAGCGAAGCDAELSDAELQTALRELDALLQRPPASAQPPDPEKVLLKRALTLALAALERTSDACLKLVNFTADAFEGLAATEA